MISNLEYINACRKPTRNSYIEVVFGLYNKNANNFLESIDGDYQEFNKPKITDNKVSYVNYVSCEPFRSYPSEDNYFINSRNPIYNANQNIGYWSISMSDEDGYFKENPQIIYLFNNLIELSNITLYFQEVVTDLSVIFYKNDVEIARQDIYGNNLLNFETSMVINDNLSYDKLTITFIRTAVPNRYVKFNNIEFGVLEVFEKNEILDIDINNETDLLSNELSSNTATITVRDYGDYNVYNESGKLQYLQERQEISIYHYLKVKDEWVQKRLGTYLLKNYSNTDTQLTLNCYDDIYFMNKIYYGSKFYNNANAVDIFKDLFNYFNYTKFDLSDIENENILLTGYIPNVEFREALRLIAEASKCAVTKTREGITRILFFDSIKDESIINLQRNEVYIDQPVKNLYNNVIDIEEYIYNVFENKEVYNSILDKGIYTINLKEYPCVNLQSSGATILESYATGAVIEVNDKTQVIVTADVFNENKIVHRINLNPDVTLDGYAVNKVSNKLITSQYYSIAEWKLSRNNVVKNLQTMFMPFLELGDKIDFVNKYNKVISMRINNINITNSIKSYLKGE